MPWLWARIKRGLDAQKALEQIDVALDRLQRALTIPEIPVSVPYTPTMTPDMSRAVVKVFSITVTDGVAMTINNPIGFQQGALMVVEVINASGGAMGAITWGSKYTFLTAWTNPANGTRATATFWCGASFLVQIANQPAAGGGGGEANTASNVGTAGVGVFDAKVGVDLQLRKINAATARLTATLDAANKKIDLDVIESALDHAVIGGVLQRAQMQTLSTGRVIGRGTASTGIPESLTVGGGIETTTTPGLQTSAFTGDVSKAAGGTVLTIGTAVVTKAMMANMATARLLGRTTAAAGVPEEISVAAELSLAALVLGIAAGGVTYAKIQNVSASPRVLGRSTAGAGSIEELTVGIGAKVTGGAIDSSSIPLSVDADQATFVNAQTNITGMSFAIAASEKWIGDFVIAVTMGTAATGVKFYFTFPLSCTGEIIYEGNVATITTWQSLYQAVLTVPGTFFVTGIITGVLCFRTTIRNAGTAGTIQLVGITGGATTTCAVKKGSSALLRRAA